MSKRGVVNINTERTQQLISEFAGIEGKVPLALSRAINRSAAAAKSEATRQVRSQYTVKAGTVNQTIKVSRATPDRLEAKIESRGSNLRLIDFSVTPTKPSPRRRTATKAAVRRGAKKVISGAFVQRMPNGSAGVFRRTGKSRLPIEQLYGPAVPVMMNNDDVVKAVQERAEQQLESRISHEINRVLGAR